jgi:hypothetical protein
MKIEQNYYLILFSLDYRISGKELIELVYSLYRSLYLADALQYRPKLTEGNHTYRIEMDCFK